MARVSQRVCEKMVNYDRFEVPTSIEFKSKGNIYDDNIYTFDIETTSLFLDSDGQYKIWSRDIPKKCEKVGICYIWQFGANDRVYYGRNIFDFNNILQQLSDSSVTKYIYIHNLAFEWNWLLNIFEKYNYTVQNMVARAPHKPIQFEVPELNIIFRCSYMLTNLSLEESAKKYTSLSKMSGDLDYNLARGLTTELSEKELKYCEYDILTLYEIINKFRDKYGHIKNIPLTQTGEVRKAINNEVDYYYHVKQWDLVPSAKFYISLNNAFFGGISNCNFIHAGSIIKFVQSYDLSSSYPAAMMLKFPCEKFWRFDDLGLDYEKYKNTHCFLYHVKLYNVTSKYTNNYLPRSKALENFGMKCDRTGRVSSADYIEYWLTDIDFNIVKEWYQIERIEIVSSWAAHKRYLDIRILNFILDGYSGKTVLKGKTGTTDAETESIENLYMNLKQRINSIYGISVTNVLNQSTEYDVNKKEWSRRKFDIDFIEEKLTDASKSYSTIFCFAVGVWVTAYARARLILGLSGFDGIENKRIFTDNHDLDTVYYDTDSLKMTGDNMKYFTEVNKYITKQLKKSCDDNGLDWGKFTPKTQNGTVKPLGLFDYEGTYEEFKTLGSKSYAFRKNGKIGLTLAGVPKRNHKGNLQPVDLLNDDLNNFKSGLVFDYEHTGKLTHAYNDEQPAAIMFNDYLGNKQIVNGQIHGMCLFPTDFTLDGFDGAIGYFNELLDIMKVKEVSKNE